MESELKELLIALIDGICRKTNHPSIEWLPSKHEFTVQVDGQDQGRMIGRSGIVVWALNALFLYAGERILKHQVTINLLNPVVRHYETPLPFKPNKNWDRPKLNALLVRILGVCVGEEEVSSIRMEELDESRVVFFVYLNSQNQSQHAEPSLGEAIGVIIGAAAKSDGCKATVETSWI